MIKYLGISAVALTTGLALAPAASAQSVAVADPQTAILKTAAFTTAIGQIKTTYKTGLDQAEAIRKELAPLEQAFDANKDGQLDDSELAKLRASPNFASIQAKEQQASQAEMPALRARAYAIEQISAKFQQAYATVKTTKRVSLVIRPEAALDFDANADITDDITAELNKLVTNVSITPPANWQPGGNPAGAPAAPRGNPPAGVPGGALPPAPTPAPAPSTGKKPSGR
jgi:Skp family chaperone for outer membrane proteins